MRRRRGGSLFGTLFAIIGILVVLVLAVGYGRGWIRFTDGDDRMNIEIDKDAARNDADDAVDDTEDALRRAGDKINNAANELTD